MSDGGTRRRLWGEQPSRDLRSLMNNKRNESEASKGRGARLHVVQDAVVGGGFDLRVGQIVCESDLGPFAAQLVAEGALVCVSDDDIRLA